MKGKINENNFWLHHLQCGSACLLRSYFHHVRAQIERLKCEQKFSRELRLVKFVKNTERNGPTMKTKSKISGYTIRSAAYAVLLSCAIVGFTGARTPDVS